MSQGVSSPRSWVRGFCIREDCLCSKTRVSLVLPTRCQQHYALPPRQTADKKHPHLLPDAPRVAGYLTHLRITAQDAGLEVLPTENPKATKTGLLPSKGVKPQGPRMLLIGCSSHARIGILHH